MTGGLELFHACKRFFLRGQDSTRFSKPFNKGWAIESQQSNQRPSCYAANKQGEENDAQRQRDDEIPVRKIGRQAQGECQGYSTLQPSPEKYGLVPQSYWFRAGQLAHYRDDAVHGHCPSKQNRCDREYERKGVFPQQFRTHAHSDK